MSTAPTESPRFLGRYELLHPLGQGGMGEVFLAKIHGAAGFEKPCIIKTVLPALLKDRQFLDRFHHEGKVLVHLVHSSIAQVYDMGEADGTYFMALEYVAGVDLAFLLEQARTRGVPVPVPVALFIGQRMAEGLGYAHRKAGPDGAPLGIVHRDVSPHNVMVSYEGEVKVIDFGLAKSAARSKYTLPSTVMGKLGYMSPEQVRAEALDHRSDIYSCGVVLWEMLAGRPLIRHGTVGEMMAAMSQPVVPELPGLRQDVDAALDAVVRRALAAKPDERYARSDELARALTGELLRTGASVGAEEVGQFVRTLCPEAFEAQRQLIAKVTSASGHRRTPAPGTGYGTGQPRATPVSGLEPTMMRNLDGTQQGAAASSPVHLAGTGAADPGAPAPRGPSRPVPTAGQEAALEARASRRRPLGLHAAIAVLLVIATAATTALFVRQPAAPVAAVDPAPPAPTGEAAAPPSDTASAGPAAQAGTGSPVAGSTGSSAAAVGTASAAPSVTGTEAPATGTPAAGTADTPGGTVVPAAGQGTQVAEAIATAGSVAPSGDTTASPSTRTPKKKPAAQPVRYVSPTRVLQVFDNKGRVYVERGRGAGLQQGMDLEVVGPLQRSGKRAVLGKATVVAPPRAGARAVPRQRMFLELDADARAAGGDLFVAVPEHRVKAAEVSEAADAGTPAAPAVDAGSPEAPAKPEVAVLYGHAQKQGGVGGLFGNNITVRNLSTQDWTGCWVVKDRRMASYLGNLKSNDEGTTASGFKRNLKFDVGSGRVGVFCNEGSFTQELE